MGKNNFIEKVRQMLTQNKRECFSIRKLTVGAVSVLLGVTFLGVSSQTAKADTTAPQTQSSQTKSKADLATYQGLKSFLKSDDSSAPAAQPSTKPAATTDKTQTSTDNGANANQTKPAPSATPAKPAASTTTDITNNDNQASTKPVAAQDKAKATVKPQDETLDYNGASRPVSDVGYGKNYLTTTDSTVYVGNWADFASAMLNVNVHDIELINNIQATPTGGEQYDNAEQRKVIIESNNDDGQMPDGGYVIDFQYHNFHNSQSGTSKNGTLDITYKNVQIYDRSFYGLFDTVNNGMSDGHYQKKVTFDNIKFTGSQMLYAGNFTDLYIVGNVVANVVASYTSPCDGITYDTESYGQQALELTSTGESVTFKTGSTFVGSSSRDDVILMHDGTAGTTLSDYDGSELDNRSRVILEGAKGTVPGAKVILNPRKNADPSKGGDPEHGIAVAGINIYNGVADLDVGKGADLIINNLPILGTSGNSDNNRSCGILMTTPDAIIEDSGTITINTNGNIGTVQDNSVANSDNKLIYDGGNLNVNPGGALNIYASNMGTYSGTLLYIGKKANLENGTLDIELQVDPNHPTDSSLGAGSGAIRLVDVSSSNALTVNNPEKLVLNASKNGNDDTSIIGDSEIDIRNVRQQFDFRSLMPNLPVITLPPFHELKVRRGIDPVTGKRTILVRGIEVLNGLSSLSPETVTKTIDPDLDANPAIKNVLAVAFNIPVAQVEDELMKLATRNVPFDKIFASIIQTAFGSKGNIGYNNISMIPTNQGGFLDIEDDNGILGQASYHQDMKDGSITVTGRVINYNSDNDGPVQPNNLFSKIMPCGTSAYVTAKFSDGSVYTDPKNKVIDPYKETNDSTDVADTTALTHDLPHTFTTKANPDGTFSFKIPSGLVGTGTNITLIPEANFVGFDPEDKTKTATVRIGAITDINQIRTLAKQALDDGLIVAQERVKASGLDTAGQQEYLARIQKAHDDNLYYISKVTSFMDVNIFKTRAIDVYNHEGAKAEFKVYANNCASVMGITDTDMLTDVKNLVDSDSGLIDTAIDCDHVESKVENSFTNQQRDWSENDLLRLYKTWVNDQLAGMVSKDVIDCPSHKLTPDQIADVKNRASTVLMYAQNSVLAAADINAIKNAYEAGQQQITDFFNSNWNNVNRDQIIQSLMAYATAQKNKLKTFTNLPRLTRNKYRRQINDATTAGLTAIINGSDAELNKNYNDFKNNVDAIMAAALAENNK